VTESKRIDDLRRRVQKDPASLAFAQLAEELRRAGELQDAIRVCRTGLTQHPEYLSARVTLGRALLASDQLDAAFTELSTALAAAPENLAALRGLAEIQHRRGDLQESLALYRRALALAPQDPDLAAAVAALEPAAPQAWMPDATPALADPAPAPAVAEPANPLAWEPIRDPEDAAATTADPSPDFASQQASLAAFFGEVQPEVDGGDVTDDWLASLDTAAAQILAADAGVLAADPTTPAVPAPPAAVTPADGGDVAPAEPAVATDSQEVSPSAAGDSADGLEAIPFEVSAPVEWIPEISSPPEPEVQEPSSPDPEAVRAEVLQRWLDAILASRSGHTGFDDRA
jgi:hypothetical protein